MATEPRPDADGSSAAPNPPPGGSRDHRLPGPKPIPAGGMALAGFKGVFRIRDFRLLFWGQAVSALGDWVGTLAFIAAAQELAPGKPAAVVGVLILRLVPSFFATPIGGVLSDRWDRQRIMIWSDVVRFGVILFAPFIPHLWFLYIFAFVHECFSLVFLPARDASLPNIVGSDHLEPANALVMGSSFAGIPLSGPVFALLAVAAKHSPIAHAYFFDHNYAFAFVFDAFTFLVSAAFIARLHLPPPVHHEGEEVEPFWSSLRDGARYIRGSRLHLGLAYAVTVAMLGGGVLFALGIGYVNETLNGSSVEFGWLMGIFGAGMVAGFVVSQLKPERGVTWMIRGALFGMGSVLIFMAVFPFLWIAYLMALVFGTSFSVSLILAMSLVQAHTPDEKRGRIMAFVHMLVRAALVFGGIASGIVGTVFSKGVRIPLIHYHADRYQIALLVAGGLIVAGVTGVRKTEAPAG
jgi:dTMP kinase